MLTRSRASKRKAGEAVLVKGTNVDAGEKVSNNSEMIKTSELLEDGAPKLQKRNYGNLSAEVLLMILKYLDSNDIASSVLPVCKTWCNVGQNPILWKELRISVLKREFTRSLENSIVAVVQRTKYLRCLTLTINGEISSILKCVAKNCLLLDSLALSHCCVNSDCAVQVIVSCLSLKHLSLDNSSGSALKEFAQLKNLVVFEVDRSREFNSDIRLFGTNIDCPYSFLYHLSKNSHQLETVKIHSSTMCSDEQVLPLLINLRSVLKEVCLWAPRCHGQTFRAIAKCKNLHSIKFNLPGSLLPADFKAMEKLKKLKKIHIEESDNLSPEAWKSFILNVNSDHIEYVCFEECENVDRILHEVLSTRDDTILHRAKTVDLSYMRISDHVLRLILTLNTSLEDLCLYGNWGFKGYAFKTTDTSIAPALRKLNVAQCNGVRLAYLKTFVKNRPGLTIEGPDRKEIKP